MQIFGNSAERNALDENNEDGANCSSEQNDCRRIVDSVEKNEDGANAPVNKTKIR